LPCQYVIAGFFPAAWLGVRSLVVGCLWSELILVADDFKGTKFEDEVRFNKGMVDPPVSGHGTLKWLGTVRFSQAAIAVTARVQLYPNFKIEKF
jgi:hypothetical protein